MKKGLILEGGGMRGLFTAGVLDILMENAVAFDGAVGVSAGAVFGINYKSNQIGRSIRYNMKYCRDDRYCSLKSLIKTGDMYGAQFCYHYLPKKLDYFDVEIFQKNPMEFYVVTTEVKTGKAVYHKIKNGNFFDMEWIRASASLPLVANSVKIGKHDMMDGGIADSIPLKFFESIGYNKNVVILTQPEGFVKESNFGHKLTTAIVKLKRPALAKTLKKRPETYNETIKYIKEREAANSVFVVRPPESLNISRTERDPKELHRVYMMGRKEGKRILADLKRYLSE